VRSAQLAERQTLSQYRAGTTNYLNVITAQALSLTNQRTAVQLRGRQLAASVSLITATGGGWSAGSGVDMGAVWSPTSSTTPTTPAPAATAQPNSMQKPTL